ncbi:MAG: HAMP domain-containing sensor histidine kinase [Planctomycetota bacterium]
MSIRAKIVVFVLLVGLSEAILLGIIGYNSVATMARNASELRRIGAAIEGTRALNVSLARLSDPVDMLLHKDGAPERFGKEMADVTSQVRTCAATACHGYQKRPPEMAQEVLRALDKISTAGTTVLAAPFPKGEPPLLAWAQDVDGPTHRLSQVTGEMAETLMGRAREIETASRSGERSALLMVALSTLFCVIVAVAFCHPIARGITRPLEELAERSRQIADGDLGRHVVEAGPRETALLARSFNRMQEDLVRHHNSLLAHQSRLEQTVAERVGELRSKDEQLKRVERLAGIGLVAGSVAHDLNNPLTNIILNTEVLLESLPGQSPQRGALEDVARDARRCREIAGDIRALCREKEFERRPCALGALAEEAIRHLRFKWEPRRITVACEVQPGMAECPCSPRHILQLLLNLFHNAVDATPDGGVVRIRVRSDARGQFIEVEDHGPGIPQAHREGLFKPFFTTKPDGTGLGLAISQRIVERHEGTMQYVTRTEAETSVAQALQPVASNQTATPAGTGLTMPAGHGTIFSVWLPAGPNGAAPERHGEVA